MNQGFWGFDVAGFSLKGLRYEGVAHGRPFAVDGGDRGTRLSTALSPTLDLGLRVFPQGVLDDALYEIIGAQDILTGDSLFDPMLRLHGDEPARVRALMTRSVRDGLVGLMREASGVYLHDNELAVEMLLLPDTALPMMARMAEVASKIEAQAKELAPARSLQVTADVLRARGLRLSTTPLRAEGELDGQKVSLSSRRHGDNEFWIDVQVEAPNLASMDLSVRRRRGLSTWAGSALALLGGAEQRFGSVFNVNAKEGSPDLESIVDAAAQSKLLALADKYEVVVEKGALTMRLGALEGHVPDMGGALDQALAIVRGMTENYVRLTSVSEGPYR